MIGACPIVVLSCLPEPASAEAVPQNALLHAPIVFVDRGDDWRNRHCQNNDRQDDDWRNNDRRNSNWRNSRPSKRKKCR